MVGDGLILASHCYFFGEARRRTFAIAHQDTHLYRSGTGIGTPSIQSTIQYYKNFPFSPLITQHSYHRRPARLLALR